jgi:hypothetical protein
MTKKEIELNGTNLSLVGRGKDSSGNQTVKLKFPNKKAFSIQTNGNLPKTKSIISGNHRMSSISQSDLEIIKDEVVDYISEDGSMLQKRMLKAYFKAGGGVGKRSTHSINQDRKRLSKEPHEQAYKPKRKNPYLKDGVKVNPKEFAKGGSLDIKNKEELKDYLIKQFDLKDETVDSFISSNSKVFKFPISYTDASDTYKKLSIAKLEKLVNSDNPMISDEVKEKAKKKIAELKDVEYKENKKAKKEVIKTFKGKKDNTTYDVVKESNGRFSIYSKSDKFDERKEFENLASKEDAIELAMLESGAKKEVDPEAGFMKREIEKEKKAPVKKPVAKKEAKKTTPKKEVKAPKDSWKDKLAMLKGKKGYKGKIANEKKAVAGTKSRSIKRDLEKKALPKGKRISKGGSNQYGKSKGGNVYYEHRANRSDIDPKEKFEKGGEVKSSGWGIDTSW